MAEIPGATSPGAALPDFVVRLKTIFDCFWRQLMHRAGEHQQQRDTHETCIQPTWKPTSTPQKEKACSKHEANPKMVEMPRLPHHNHSREEHPNSSTQAYSIPSGLFPRKASETQAGSPSTLHYGTTAAHTKATVPADCFATSPLCNTSEWHWMTIDWDSCRLVLTSF
ncbi:Hypothetical predicted protein [Pelobates cultripes]|uniref:Uncharacterized protein n=1 Tax=Pelobates cultripes TaxID=61616 RepID=A0AAD1QYC3_PELCU|nr:Hypothetical predicted protein [Pelobates cultripes]